MQILSTKLFTPPLRSRVVARPRLLQKLNQGMDCNLVLVSAPAGYGKSTLLSAWLSRLQYPAVWYSLDDSDNDPIRFLNYLAAALGKIHPSLGDTLTASLQGSHLPEIEPLLTPLVNRLLEVDQPFCLVLDDYHLIQNEEVHQVVRFLLDQRPAPLHLAIATRADPPFALNRLRARSAVVELRLADLRFTQDEAADFFKHTMEVKVSPEDVARITGRTEGWIAGMQIAALSMQNIRDIPGFITAFTGSHHQVFDYLMEEILTRQSPEIRRFLLQASIFEQFCAPLCDALSIDGAEASSARSSAIIIDELEHANLFIIPLDHQRRWYRFHPLFLELLRSYLQQNNAEWMPVLHAKASAWFEEQELIADAIRHALAAGEWDRVLRLISANVFALLEQNELSSLSRQLESVSSGKNPARPWLWIGRAWLAAYTGQIGSVEQLLNSAAAEKDSIENQAIRQTLGGHIAAIRAFASWVSGDQDKAVQAAQEALECLPATDYLLRCQSATVLGLSRDKMNERAHDFEQALTYAREISVSHVTIFAYGCWAYMLFLQGRLHEAHAACHEAIRLAQSSHSRQPLPTLSHIYSTLSEILSEWNDLEGCITYAQEAVALAKRWEQADALHFAYTNLGSALFENGDVERAFHALSQAWQVAYRTSVWYQQITIAQEVGWYLAQDNLGRAIQRLQTAQIDFEDVSMTDISPNMRMLSARVFLAQKQYSRALAVNTSSLAALEKRNIGYFVVRSLIFQAIIYQELGQEAQALASLKQALTTAAPEGYVRSFLVPGGGLNRLLHKARAAGITPQYVDKLLEWSGQTVKFQPAQANGSSQLVEPLSGREMDVMKLLAQGCSDKKIADSLVIAPETVHKHLKNIYGKLDVHRRTEAIARARELGLL